MRRRRSGLLSWVVLLVYVAGTSAASRSVVLCRELDGATTIEIVGDHGQCLGGGGLGSAGGHADHVAGCGGSCCDTCPCEDSPLASEPARVVKKDPPPGEVLASVDHGVPPGLAEPRRLRERPAARPPAWSGSAVTEVTRRSLRSVVLLL